MTLSFQSGKSVKDKVIITLGYSWPLKPKEILQHIKRNLNANITYQAVYKSVNELLQEGVIIKKGKGFMLNKEWVDTLKDYSTYVEQSYKSGIPKKDILEPGQITVDCLRDFYYFVLMTLEKLSNDEYVTKMPVAIRGTHEWSPMILGKEEFTRMVKIIKKYKVYSTVLLGTPLGEAMTKYWESVGIHLARTTQSTFIDTSADTVIVGDYVIQAMLPNKLVSAMSSFYDNTTSVNGMDLAKFQNEILYKNYDISIITVKNKALAEGIRKEVLGFFEKR